jgi:hypothetical protein
LRQFQTRLYKLETKGVNVDALSVEKLDQEYEAERNETRGVYAATTAALLSGAVAGKARGVANAPKSGPKWSKNPKSVQDKMALDEAMKGK